MCVKLNYFAGVVFILCLFVARRVWKDYFPAVDGIVFLIDAFDRQRYAEARAELDSLLSDEQVASAPVLVLGNKIDMPGAGSEDELRHMFGLHGKTTGKVCYSLSHFRFLFW